MKVLVLNCGSSSIKYKLFEMTTKEVLAQGGIEKIGLPGSFLKLTLPNGEKKVIEKDVPEHTTGIQFIFDTLTNAEYGAVSNLHEIKAVGHRVLHGGTKFSGSVLIDDAVIAAVEECCDLGPLHNPANLKGIYAVQKLLPEVPQELYSILHSTRLCRTTLTCTRYLTSISKNTVSVVMVSTELLTATFQSVYVNS